MRNIVSFSLFPALLVTVLASHTAIAGEEQELPSVEDSSAQAEVFLPSDQHKKDCSRSGRVCFFADGAGTIAGTDIDPSVGIVTTLARGIQVAGAAATGQGLEAEVWHAEMIARLRARTASTQPVIVAVMDYADPEGMAKKEAVAVWQIDGAATKDLGIRLALSSEDGFLPQHTYLVRIVQGAGAQERVLAEGNFLLE
jgi:hypothetical protein